MKVNRIELDEIKAALETVGGIIRVVRQNEVTPRTYCIADLEYSNELTVNDIFRAVRELYGKAPEDYGSKWPSFRNAENKISNRFNTIKQAFERAGNDLEKLKLACAELGEVMPVIINKEEVQKRLDAFHQLKN